MSRDEPRVCPICRNEVCTCPPDGQRKTFRSLMIVLWPLVAIAVLASCSSTPADEPGTPVIAPEGFFLGDVKIWTGCWKGDRIYWRGNESAQEQMQIIDNDPTCPA
jgi:hypothetical protein